MKGDGIKTTVGRGFKLLGKIGDVVSPNDPEVVRRFEGHVNEQDMWNDLFSTKLIEVLDKIDDIRTDAQTSLRRGESALASAKELTDAAHDRLHAMVLVFAIMVVMIGCAWLATTWALWLAFHEVVPNWIPALISAVIVAGATVVVLRVLRAE